MQNQFFPGGFAEFCLVTCGGAFRPIVKIPDELDDIRATLFEPLSCAMRIVDRLKLARGSRILILGLGAMGLISGLLLKRSGLETIVVGVDTRPRRVNMGRSLGLDGCVVLEPGRGDGIIGIKADFDVVIDATGVASVFPIAVDHARLGGTVILAGVPVDSIPFSPLPIFRKELTIIGAKGPVPFPKTEGGSRVMDLLLSSHIPWDRLVSVFPFLRATEAFRYSMTGESLKAILTW